MKKKKPTLTHYTKRLKKVRLARTITVIATLFVSGVVVAANVLPQVIQSNASTTNDTSNDVIAGGVDQWSGPNAKSQLVQKVFTETGDQAQSTKALYTRFGVSQSDIQNSTFKWLYGPNVTGSKVSPNAPITPYGNWRSFGRSNNVGYSLLEVAYGSKVAKFYHKPMKDVFPTWDTGKSATPVLMDNSPGGPKWFIILNCGNIVVPTVTTTQNPSINFTKAAVSVIRGTKTFTQAEVNASGFRLQLKDQLTYRINGKNSSVAYPAGLRLIDQIPTGTKLVSQGGDGWPNTTLTKVANATVNGKPAVAWDFSAIPANQGGYTDFRVEVTAVTSQICNIALYGKPGNLPADTNQVCLQVQPTAPLLTITKKANNAPTSLKVGDKVTYTIEMTNTGNAEATNALAFDILKRDSAGKLSQTFDSLGVATLKKISDQSTVATTLTAVKDNATQDQYANKNRDAFGYVVSKMPVGTKLSFSITTKAAILPQACDFAIGNYKDSGNPIAVTVSPDVCTQVVSDDQPQITVVKSSPTANRNVARGQTINYDIVVRNKSAKAAQTTPITVTDTFTPPGYAKNLKFTSSASFTGLSITTTQQTDGFVWKIARIPANGVVTIKVSATVADNAVDGEKFCNNATIAMVPGNPIVSETSSTVCNTVSLIKPSKTAKYLDRGEDPQKSPANAGDRIEYTLTTTNQAAVVAKDYIVAEELGDVLAYADLDESTLDGATLTGTKLTWPIKDIPAGGSITNKFTVIVKDPIPNNLPSVTNPNNFDYNMFNNYGNDVNIKINKPLIQQFVDVATNLPQTGAAQYGLVIFFLGLSVYFFVRNKQLTGELAAATVEYQHQESADSFSQAQELIHPEAADDTTPEPPATPPAAQR